MLIVHFGVNCSADKNLSIVCMQHELLFHTPNIDASDNQWFPAVHMNVLHKPKQWLVLSIVSHVWHCRLNPDSSWPIGKYDLRSRVAQETKPEPGSCSCNSGTFCEFLERFKKKKGVCELQQLGGKIMDCGFIPSADLRK